MIQPELFTRLRLLAEAYRLPVAAPDRAREITPASAVQQVLAEVEARLPDGRFRVLAAGQRFDVDLPPGTKPGERLQVSLPIGSNSAAATAQRNPAVETVHARVSEAGRFIAQLMQDGKPGERSPTSIAGAQALLPDAPIDVGATAATLRELIGLSGLFYESHQAEWVSGQRDTAQLLREPQGRNPPIVARQMGSSLPASGSQGPISPPGADPGAALRPGEGDSSRLPPLVVHPDAAPIIQQQINTLESSHIVWNGQIWPRQSMRWEVEAADGESGRPGEAIRSWQTRIDLDLPRLGGMTAILNLGPAGLQVRLSAQTTATDTLFAGHLAELRSALTAAGMPLASLTKVAHADT